MLYASRMFAIARPATLPPAMTTLNECGFFSRRRPMITAESVVAKQSAQTSVHGEAWGYIKPSLETASEILPSLAALQLQAKVA